MLLILYHQFELPRVRPMTAGRRRPPQHTISSNILSTTKVQAAVNHEMNQCKAIMSLFKFNFDLFNFT